MNTACENDKFITLIVSLEGKESFRRRVRKDVIQSESSFVEEYIEDGASEVNIPLKQPKNLNLILKYLYEEQFTVRKENHLKSFWNDAKILGLVSLQKFCVQRLTDTISLDSWIQILEFSQAEGCHELESNVLSFVTDNFENCCGSSSFKSHTVDQMVQVLQLPTVKATVTESNQIALIVDWNPYTQKWLNLFTFQNIQQWTNNGENPTPDQIFMLICAGQTRSQGHQCNGDVVTKQL